MNTVNVNIIEGGQKGTRNLILSVFLQSDGASGDLNKQVLLDPTSLGLPSTSRFSLYRVHYNFAGFDGILEFDSGVVTPTFRWVLVEGANAPEDFEPLGGLKDLSGIDGTGKLMISTLGFNSSQDVGSIIIKLRMPNDS